MTDSDKPNDSYSDEDAKARAAATLKAMLATPHKPHKEAAHGRGKKRAS